MARILLRMIRFIQRRSAEQLRRSHLRFNFPCLVVPYPPIDRSIRIIDLGDFTRQSIEHRTLIRKVFITFELTGKDA
jgi:hypothetical protein